MSEERFAEILNELQAETAVQIRLWATRRYAPRRAVKQSDPLTRSLPVKGAHRWNGTLRQQGKVPISG
jgi:hypothetical protein